MKRRRNDFEDDGRVVAPMDGLPSGMLEQTGWLGARRPASRAAKEPEARQELLTPAQTRSFIGGALLAALAVAGVFAAAGALFILFCTQVWLR